MKRITLLMVAFLGAISMNAQSSCAAAQALTVGNNASSTVTVTTLSGDPTPISISCVTANDGTTNDQNGAWYSYTPTQDVMVTVTTDLASNGTPTETGGNPDPNFYYPTVEVFTGACGSLAYTTCDFGDVGDGNAEVTFVAVTGTTYYIAFNDILAQLGAGSITGFDFEISTDTNVPATPGNVTNPTPADDATDVVIDEADNDGDGVSDMAVGLSWTAATDGVNVDGYRVYWGTTAPTTYSDLSVLGVTANTSVGITNVEYNTEYFWAIVPVNGPIPADEATVQIWSFTTEATAGIEDSQLAEVSLYPNPMQDQLNINLPNSIELESATMFDLLGQQTAMNIGENNTLNTSNLASGVYILKLETNQGTMTKKVIKQ